MSVPTLSDLVDDFYKGFGPLKLALFSLEFSRRVKRTKGIESTENAFSYIWNLEETKRLLAPSRAFSEKSDADSNRLRLKGNDYYKLKAFQRALDHYNLSILAAPHPQLVAQRTEDSEEHLDGDPESQCRYQSLAWAYSNRSAVLFVLKKYKLCLRDIELALCLTNSEVLVKKLKEREQKCQNLLENSSMVGDDVNDELSRAATPPKIIHRNPALPALSTALEMAYSVNKGRHLVATRNIRPGEILGVEESYCKALETEHLQSYCSVCLVKCIAPIPCPNCSMVVFCSTSCRDKGLQDEHWLECSVLPSISVLDSISKVMLVYKMLNRTPYKELKRLKLQMEREMRQCPPAKRGFDQNGVYCSRDYRSLYHLVTNKDKRECKDLFSRCVMAIILTKILDQGGKYFIGENGEAFLPSNKDLVTVGAFIFTHLMQIDCNFHPLLVGKSSDTSAGRPMKDCLGVFPTFSLLNHSCSPTTVFYSCGSSLVLMALRSIPEGAEATECYGFTYDVELPQIRQAVLKSRFQMFCSCEACDGGWPINIFLPGIEFKCYKCQHPVDLKISACRTCPVNYRNPSQGNEKSKVKKWWQNVSEVKAAQEKVANASMLTKQGQSLTDQSLSDICRYIELLERHVHLPCRQHCMAQHFLASVILSKST